MPDTEKWMTRAEVAEFLRVPTRTVDAYARDRLLPRFYLAPRGQQSKSPRFRIEDVRALVKPERDAT